MSEPYILRIGNDGKPRSLLSFDAQSTCHKKTVTSWSDQALKSKPLTLLLPGNWLYLTKTEVPSKSSDVLEKSIPYAVEEELSNEVEDNYFAFRQTSDRTQDVIAIEKKYLDQVGEAIRSHQLEIKAIYSEYDWLPAANNKIVLWFEKTYALLRFGSNEVMRASHQQVSQLIPVFKGDLTEVYSNQSTGFDHNDLHVDNSLDEVKCKNHLLNHRATDLYLDAIKESRKDKTSSSWKSTLTLVVVLVLSWLGINIYQLMQLNNDIERLKDQQQQVFKQSFPDAAAAELIDPYAAIKSRMQLSSNQSLQTKSILLDAMQFIGLVTKNVQQIQINGIRLVNEQMEVQVSAPNIATINSFHQQLQLSAIDYRIQIGVNELDENNSYKSIITVVPR